MGWLWTSRTEHAYVSRFPTAHRPGLLRARAVGHGFTGLSVDNGGEEDDEGKRWAEGESVVLFVPSQPRFKQLHTTSKCPKTRENKFAPRKQTNTRTNSPQLGYLSPPSLPACSLTLRKAWLETL